MVKMMYFPGAFEQCVKDKDCPEDNPGCNDGFCVQCTSSKRHCKEQVRELIGIGIWTSEVQCEGGVEQKELITLKKIFFPNKTRQCS